jgi:membrane-bound metal-dependent hydrolase YbcI (DUF457 family)
MAGFKTHITVSSVIGVGYGWAACHYYGVPWPADVLAAGLCGVSGMLPDLDSDSGTPLRESVAFAASVIPIMLMPRFQHMQMPHESMILAGGAVYLFVRFGLAGLLRRCTAHRGMFHSLPAAAVSGEIAFLLCTGEDVRLRGYKAAAVVLGYVSHLVLDEMWSIRWMHGLRPKHSFGSALKLYGRSVWANVVVFAILAALTSVIYLELGGTGIRPVSDVLRSVQGIAAHSANWTTKQ